MRINKNEETKTLHGALFTTSHQSFRYQKPYDMQPLPSQKVICLVNLMRIQWNSKSYSLAAWLIFWQFGCHQGIHIKVWMRVFVWNFLRGNKEWIYDYITTTVKHAIWLVNSRAGSGYPARGIKMRSRDSQNVSYFIKQLPNGFPCRIAWSMHWMTFGKA
jgi:hypothetical protein